MRKEPSWLKNAIFYEIYPQSFYDTDGDGIGDLKGVIKKLDYVKSLGVNAIWLNPFYDSPFADAGYDITDFYRVAPRYGTNDDFAELCREAHDRGIKVICDLVACHSSVECEWFKKSSQSEKNEFTDRYVWCDDDKSQYEKLYRRDYERNDRYLASFYDIQPAFNYGFYEVREPWQLPIDAPQCLANRRALRDIIDYWIGLGCDGYRVDMAGYVVKNDPEYIGTKQFWNEFRDYFDEKYPECVLLPEWSRPHFSLDAGFHLDMFLSGGSLFRYELNEKGKHSYFRREGKGNRKFFTDDYVKWLEKANGKGYVSLITGDHDMHRLTDGRDNEEMKTIFAFLMTLPGTPMIYYGEEIGMRNVFNTETEGSNGRGCARTPMQWEDPAVSKNFGFSTADTTYLRQDQSADAPYVDGEENDESSLLNTVRTLTDLRHRTRALWADGGISFIGEQNYPMHYERSYGGESVRVIINPSGDSYDVADGDAGDILYAHSVKRTADGFAVGGCGAVIYTVKK